MRRPTSVLASAVLGTALAASTVTAQMSPPASAPGPGVQGSAAVPASVTASPSDAPVNPARGARHLLRNGWDYITYQEFDRALLFFREAERRQKELTDVERIKLQQGIERAQRGVREKAMGVKGDQAYALSGGQRRPGGLALARPAGSLAPASAVAANAPARSQPASARTPVYEPEPIQLAGGGGSNLNLQPATDVKPVSATVEPQPEPQLLPEPQPQQVPVSSPAPMPAPPEMEVPGVPLPKLGARPEVGTPTPATADQDLRPAQGPAPAAETPTPPVAASEPASSADAAEVLPELPPPPQDVPLPVPANHLPVPVSVPSPSPLGEPARVASPAPTTQPMPVPVNLPTVEDEQLVPLPPSLSDRPRAEPPAETTPTPAPTPAPVPVETPAPAPVLPTEIPQPQPLAGLPGSRAVEPSPAPAAAAATAELPPAPAAEDLPASPAAAPSPGLITVGNKPSSLSPELQEEVARIAQRQDDELRQRPPAPAPGATPPGDITLPLSATGPTNRSLEISRAPSPTEARPIKGIPVPEEFVTLPKREWDPNRKYWAAAATCHLPLYFQDASLERYGYSMEQRFGRAGRFLTYPLDDPRQSKQRMQLIQPMFSAGLMAFQIGMLPYNLIMDPPWEAEYDLGYYRPGDRVPTDVFYLPLTGVGPPLRGKNYGNPPGQGYNQPNGPAAYPAPRW